MTLDLYRDSLRCETVEDLHFSCVFPFSVSVFRRLCLYETILFQFLFRYRSSSFIISIVRFVSFLPSLK